MTLRDELEKWLREWYVGLDEDFFTEDIEGMDALLLQFKHFAEEVIGEDETNWQTEFHASPTDARNTLKKEQRQRLKEMLR